MLDKAFYVITFESTHLAISTEKLLLAAVAVEMVPTPREISASCGLSLKVKIEHLDQVIQVLSVQPKTGMKLYHMLRENGQKIATEQEWRD